MEILFPRQPRQENHKKSSVHSRSFKNICIRFTWRILCPVYSNKCVCWHCASHQSLHELTSQKETINYSYSTKAKAGNWACECCSVFHRSSTNLNAKFKHGQQRTTWSKVSQFTLKAFIVPAGRLEKECD